MGVIINGTHPHPAYKLCQVALAGTAESRQRSGSRAVPAGVVSRSGLGPCRERESG